MAACFERPVEPYVGSSICGLEVQLGFLDLGFALVIMLRWHVFLADIWRKNASLYLEREKS